MSIRIEIDPELAAQSVESLREVMAEETAKIEAIQRELKSIGADISAGVFSGDVDQPLDLMRRRSELPFRLLAHKVRRAQIEIALCDVRIREAEPALAEAAAELNAKENAFRKAQENRERAFAAWHERESEQQDLKDRLRALAVHIRDLREEQLRLIAKAAA